MIMTDTKTAAKKRSPGTTQSDGAAELKGVAPDTALHLMREMLLYRRFEEKAEEAYAIGKIGGFCHLHIGQEAAAAGSIRTLRDDDYVISAYREHTQALAKGITPKAIMAELYGRADGCSGGRGGSMHLFDPTKGFMGGNGIVGGQIPTATGFGFAIKYKGGDQVSLCFLGDAAVNQGSFHESLNLAAVWKLPVIYAVENNEYGMGTAFNRVSAREVKHRGDGYGIPCHVVNGQDVLETYVFFSELVASVRQGAGPQYVDVRTYRFKGHSMSDPVSGTYRSKEEVERRTEQDDPIRLLRERLFAAGVLDQAGLEEMDAEIRAIVNEAAEFADASPLPDVASLYEHTYATINEHGRLFVDSREEAPRAADES
jgi:pyruvate dehydrogenase E1 component alpha subunit